MRLSEMLRLVWINIMESKFKVMLTALGIIVGSATIVLVIAIGRGGQMDVEDQFKNLSAGTIDISVGSSTSEMGFMDMMGGGGFPGGSGFPGGGGNSSRTTGGGAPSGGGGAPSAGGGFPGGGMMGGSSTRSAATLSEEDVEDILTYVSDVSAASLVVSGTAAVQAGDMEEESDYTVVGVQPSYAEISNLEVMMGSFFEDYDVEDRSKVVVIGYSLAEEIFGSAYYAYGDVMSIEGKTYEIIGVLQSMGTVSSGISPDSAIYMPYSTATKYVLGSSAEPTVSVVASSVSVVDSVMESIEALLQQNYPNASFTLSDAGSKMEAASASADTLSALLIAVASIVFVVGGIGIMNVLFVSVKERTGEIGLLKALGSSKQEILLEFLFEANFISILGGVLGVGMGYGLVPLIRLAADMRLEPTASGGVLSVVFAVLTGTVFGFYPALKASKLTPIEALNQE